MNLASLLVRSAADHRDRPAIRLGDAITTYRELDAASARVAALLNSRGVAPGDRVGLMLPNVAEFPAVYYGILRAGAVVVPMNPLLKSREVGYYLSDSGASALFVWDTVADEATAGADGVETYTVAAGFTDALPPADGTLTERDADDTAVILYTSGTTGRPKGAELTHDNLMRNVEVVLSDLMALTPEDVVFGGLPLFHAFGQTVSLNASIAAGASVSLMTRFEPIAALEQLATHNATVFAGVPTMYSAFLAVPNAPELPGLRVCVSGGAALPVEVLYQFERAFGCMILEGYGLSETSPVASFNMPTKVRKPGTIGTPVTGVEMRVVDADGQPVAQGEIGEIAIRGHNIMKGYYQRPEATAEVLAADGWFRTGDMGRMDADGYFAIVDRKKDLIIRGGFNIYPREIEEVLYEHPAIAEAAVVGVPHESLGEEVGAAVALKAGANATQDELRAYVKAQVAAYKYPRHIWIVDALPKGATGKILKREISIPDFIAAQAN
ncbi:long-chain-fatty-acid--CoA ligase [Smaragdicoccus niigatensis]|uniref:long-chain-fatty-acid--CoA ligase n=1 Tax=Smaragdicoccus niigatensis TaxID=359359 RepID=UPI000365B4A7|nr:long-chain fatty acid--CoA ligase [Smaragdicoccus niigatensis]